MRYLLAFLLLVLPISGMTQSSAVQTGYAVYYNGLKDSETNMTAAHPTLPKGTWVEVKHQKTGKTVLVKINDRGPFGNKNRIIDLSIAAARALGIISEGVAPVELRVVSKQ
ncbi:septal ring lytic transglycosylase RlpA family protein [Deinococcus misasensis]|uniref:septal ring lytic transglycosylase RlpA family protein n=1 Tax=Deinococcus misasensis TaxID=392413 RepID=UPI00054DC9EC|nr:septal ring lytic transglycosylase RlpA family protein [Deinococcus misasensis]